MTVTRTVVGTRHRLHHQNHSDQNHTYCKHSSLKVQVESHLVHQKTKSTPNKKAPMMSLTFHTNTFSHRSSLQSSKHSIISIPLILSGQVLYSITTIMTKPCTLCSTPRDILIRCQIDDTQKWHFVCPGTCWKSVSGGVEDAKGFEGKYPHYKYGGMVC